MRGFRASRAMTNSKSSRFGTEPTFNTDRGGYTYPGQKPANGPKIALPEWLKMPAAEVKPIKQAKAKKKTVRVAKAASSRKKAA